MDFGFDIIDGIGRLHLKGDSLTREGFDEDLHLDLMKNKGYQSRLRNADHEVARNAPFRWHELDGFEGSYLHSKCDPQSR